MFEKALFEQNVLISRITLDLQQSGHLPMPLKRNKADLARGSTPK